MNMERLRPTIVGGAVFVVALGGMFLTVRYKTTAWLAVAVASVAIVTFFGFFWMLGGVASLTKNRMRNTITAAFVVTYLVLLGYAAFQSQGPAPPPAPVEQAAPAAQGERSPAPQTQAGTSQPTSIASALVENFTVLMGVVVAFYFGGTALENREQMKAIAANPERTDEIRDAAEH